MTGIIPAVFGQSGKMTTKEYIKKYKDIAIKDMKTYKIPASITLAQGILESGSGNSKLARKANNHFGIKCHNDWHGKRIFVADDIRHDCFRKYKNPEASYRDHSKFLTKGQRYAFLFSYPITDYKDWAYGLKRAGYATNPRYPQLLINYIEKYHLYKYDRSEKRHTKKNRKSRKAMAYLTPVVSSFAQVRTSMYGRPVLENNGCRLIVVKPGDTYNKVAAEFEINTRKLLRYNDLKKTDILHPGELLYIEKKASKAEKGYKFHIVKQGETLWKISQIYGIKLSSLLDRNNLPRHYQASTGTKLRVR
jgi:LysM repeat protein